MTIRLAVANTADKPGAAQAALAHADYLMLNECRDTVKAWVHRRTRLKGGPIPIVDAYVSGRQNVHMWRTAQVHVVAHGVRVLLVGGRRGLGKSKRDRRRRGPTRDAPWQLVTDVDTHRLLILVDPHLLARTTTSERWRRPLMLLSLARLRALLKWLQLRWPGVPIVAGGDGNLPKLGQWKLGKGWRVIDTPADFGRRHYTQLYVHGPVVVGDVRELHTSSDHDAILCTLDVLAGAPTRA